MSSHNPTVSIEITARELHVLSSLLGYNTGYITLRDKLCDADVRMRAANRQKNRESKAARTARKASRNTADTVLPEGGRCDHDPTEVS